LETKGLKYAYNQNMKKGKRTVVFMHRFIMGVDKNQIVDHINGNGLDNRRENLRICTRAQNQRNQKKHSTPGLTSRFKGVSLRPFGRWATRIQVNKKQLNIGSFDTEIEAAKAYDKAAKKIHKEFCRLNFGSCI